MKGVAKVSGPKNPKVGETNFYEATEFHNGTVVTNPNEIKWILYEYEDGKWSKLDGPIKTGKKVTFSFPQKWYGKQLLIEAYLFEPEGKSLPGLIVSPVMGEKKIIDAEILNGSGGAITEKPKYGQSITLKVKTDNMLGDTLKLSLWDRDTVGMPAHTPSLNQLLWSGTAKINDKSGIVQQKVMLSPALRQLANKSLIEGDTHEYYLFVEGNNAVKLSQTTEVSNEIMLSPNPPPKPKSAPAPAPVMPTAQVPVKVKNGVGTEIAPVGGTNVAVVEGTSVENCEQKYCIKKGEKSELIREINIRLAGFGGNVPTDEFTDRTEKMIKQFQKDYMKITPTGRICGNLLKAIDQFQASISVNFNEIKCKCGGCNGYGSEKYAAQYQDTSIAESGRAYEYPGVHRSLLHGYRASIFYLEKDKSLGYQNKLIFSGYRCWINNDQHGRKSTNHMGKAIDIHYQYRDGQEASSDADVSAIRLNIFNKYLGAEWDWTNKNIFNLESSAVGATSWIHVDVREFSQQYLKKQYYVKDLAALNGKSILALATELGFQKTCICNGTGNNSAPAAVPQPVNTKCYCNRDFTVDELKKIVATMRATEGIADKSLFSAENCPLSADDKSYERFAVEINKSCKKHGINNCIQKIHFFAQTYWEADRYQTTLEYASGDDYNPGVHPDARDSGNTVSGDGPRYRGRGLMQLTWRNAYEAYFNYLIAQKSPLVGNRTINQLLTRGSDDAGSLIGSKLELAVDSAARYWVTKKISKQTLNENALYGDQYIDNISRTVNGGGNGMSERKEIYKKLKDVLKITQCINFDKIRNE